MRCNQRFMQALPIGFPEHFWMFSNVFNGALRGPNEMGYLSFRPLTLQIRNYTLKS